MVHRDVKPENVLISRSAEVKVADFGLVTAAAQAGQSHAGMIMGTVAYLSPEQVATGAADARSDVYAAGVLLYELLTGAPPYSGDTPISVAYRHVNSDVPPPSLIAGDVPPELDELVLRATRRDPAARPADAAAMLAELRRWRRTSRCRGCRSRCRRHGPSTSRRRCRTPHDRRCAAARAPSRAPPRATRCTASPSTAGAPFRRTCRRGAAAAGCSPCGSRSCW